MDSKTVLEIKNVSVSFSKRKIIDNVSFEIKKGEASALIGPNGAGKTVLLRAILGTIVPDKGSVVINGRVTYIPQKVNVDFAFPLTVNELLSATSSDKVKQREYLKRVGLPNAENRRLATLSGGQLQRVLIARSLLTEPDILILDEPAAGIDTAGQQQVYGLLDSLKHELGFTLLLVSHELDIVMRYADHVLCLNEKLLCSGIPKDVLTPDMLKQMYGGPIKHTEHSHAN